MGSSKGTGTDYDGGVPSLPGFPVAGAPDDGGGHRFGMLERPEVTDAGKTSTRPSGIGSASAR